MGLISIANGILTQGNTRPFELGGAVYQIALSLDTFNFECYKSSDQGATWNQVSVGVVTSSQTFSVCSDGSKLYLIYIDDNTQLFCVQVFDPATDTWTNNYTSVIGAAGGNAVFTFWRSTDNVVICGFQANDLQPAPNRGRCGYFKFDIAGGTFSALVPFGETNPAITEDWNCYGVLAGNGCVHLLILVLDNDGFGPGSTMRQQALSDVDVLGPIQTIATQALNFPSTLPSGYGDGTSLYVAWGPVDFPTNNTLDVFIGPSDAAAPVVFASQSIVTGLNVFFQFAPLIIAGTYYAFLCTNDGSTDYKVRQYTDSGAGFDAGQVIDTESASIFCRWATSVSFQPFALIVEGSLFWFGSGTVPFSSLGTIRLNAPLPGTLPDPRVLCSRSTQKRCVAEDGRCIQMSKLVIGVYPQ